MKRSLLFIILIGLISGCIPQFQISQNPSINKQLSDQNLEGISISILEDSIISYKRLAQRSARKNLQLLSFKIENTTTNEMVIDYQKIEAISTNKLELMPVLSPMEYFTELKNKPYDEVIAGVLGGALMFTYSNIGLTFIPYSPTWLISLAAVIQLIRNNKINHMLQSELLDKSLQGKSLQPGESKIGVVSVKAESSEGLILRYSMN